MKPGPTCCLPAVLLAASPQALAVLKEKLRAARPGVQRSLFSQQGKFDLALSEDHYKYVYSHGSVCFSSLTLLEPTPPRG